MCHSKRIHAWIINNFSFILNSSRGTKALFFLLIQIDGWCSDATDFLSTRPFCSVKISYFRVTFLHFIHDVFKINTLINKVWVCEDDTFPSPQTVSKKGRLFLKFHLLSLTWQVTLSTGSFTQWLISHIEKFLNNEKTSEKQQTFKYVWDAVSLTDQKAGSNNS